MIHKLKTWNPYFSDIIDGKKSFEIRKNDRNFQVRDQLLLQEYDHVKSEYLERNCLCEVVYVFQGGKLGLEEGYIVMGIKKCEI